MENDSWGSITLFIIIIIFSIVSLSISIYNICEISKLKNTSKENTEKTTELEFNSPKQLKLDKGKFEFSWETSYGYDLHIIREYDQRITYTHSVDFYESYSSIPEVIVTFTKFDLSNTENTRIGLRAFDITKYGFKVEIYTWAKSRVFTGEVSWFSYGY